MKCRLLTLALLVMLIAGCSSESGLDTTITTLPTGPADELVATVASYDAYVGEQQRVIVGVLTGDQRDVGLGTARMRFAFQSSGNGEASPEPPTEWADARFLALPGEPVSGQGPRIVGSGEGRGVYASDTTFAKPGFYQVEIEAEVVGLGRKFATSAIQVRDDNQFPAVGEESLRSENLTIDSRGVALKAIDSRAVESVPDPRIHDSTIASAIAQRKPALVAFATPVFCRSRFCGPTLDLMTDLERDYGTEVDVIHVEVWKDFEAQQPNDVAADWLLRNDDLPEPWVYLIGADGRIEARWDNVATRAEIEPELQRIRASS